MYRGTAFGTYKLRSLYVLLAPSGPRTSTLSLHHFPYTSTSEWRYGYSMNQGLQFIYADRGFHSAMDTNMGKDNNGNLPPAPPVPPKPGFPTWARWVLGSILSLFLPFSKKKWEELLRLEGEVEIVAEEVENVAEVIEKVATITEKVAAEVEDMLPHDGKLKEAAFLIEHISKEAARDAQLTINFIHKVDHLKQDVEMIVEPDIDKGKI
ncbi:hypothetical protein HHK36_008139 [Tetracentron sinense]|uniref:Uncharacterized protein n=1 Tax=Tetracentron sinense TaxID=13715 RepID=A0A834ZEA0_TETSI|nr:hypothetical protein HHK36_008139 [Tetracentron sinense]